MHGKIVFFTVWSMMVSGTIYALIQEDRRVGEGEPIALLQAKQGNVQYRPEDLVVWSDVVREQMFFEGDNVSTDQGAKAKIEFVDGRTIVLGENTQVTLSSQGEKKDSSFVAMLQEYTAPTGPKVATKRNTVVTLVKGSIETSRKAAPVDLEKIRREQRAREQALAAKALQEEREKQKVARRLEELAKRLKLERDRKIAEEKRIAEEKKRLARLAEQAKKERDRKKRAEMKRRLAEEKKKQKEQFEATQKKLAQLQKRAAERAEALKKLKIEVDQDRFAVKSITKPVARKKKSKRRLAKVRDDDFNLQELGSAKSISTPRLAAKVDNAADLGTFKIKSGGDVFDLKNKKSRIALFKPEERKQKAIVKQSDGKVLRKDKKRAVLVKPQATPLKKTDAEVSVPEQQEFRAKNPPEKEVKPSEIEPPEPMNLQSTKPKKEKKKKKKKRPKLAVLKSDSSRISFPRNNSIMWTDTSLRSLRKFNVGVKVSRRAKKNKEERKIPVLRVWSGKDKNLPKIVVSSESGSLQQTMKLPIRRLIKKRYGSKYEGMFDELQLKLQLGVRIVQGDLQGEIRWKKAVTNIVLRSLKTDQPVKVFVSNFSEQVSSSGGWFYQQELPKKSARMAFYLASGKQLGKIIPYLRGAKQFSIRSGKPLRGDGVYIAKGRDVLARVRGPEAKSSENLKAVRLALGGDVVFRGKPNVYVKNLAIAKKGMLNNPNKRIFVVEGGKIVAIDKSFLEGSPEVEDFFRENFKDQIEKAALEIIDN